LTHIECELGHHNQELQQARRLAMLRPGYLGALQVLRKAATCNGQQTLARQLTAKIQTLEGESLPARSQPTVAPRVGGNDPGKVKG
jgi:hypothetical protein